MNREKLVEMGDKSPYFQHLNMALVEMHYLARARGGCLISANLFLPKGLKKMNIEHRTSNIER